MAIRVPKKLEDLRDVVASPTAPTDTDVWWLDTSELPQGNGDVTPPEMTAFTIPPNYGAFAIPILSMDATDEVGVTGYLVTESATPPLPGDQGWTVSPPATYTVDSEGLHTLYGWAKDAAGNVSASLSDSCTITLGLVFDDFSDGNLNTQLWSPQTSGSGSVAETTYLTLSGTQNTDAAAIVYRTGLPAANSWDLRVDVRLPSAGLGVPYDATFGDVLNILRKTTQPVAGPAASIPQRIILRVNSSGLWTIIYISISHGATWWTAVQYDWQGRQDWDTMRFHLSSDGTNFTAAFRDASDNLLAGSGPIAWSDLAPGGEPGSLWLAVGDMFNDIFGYTSWSFRVSQFEHS